MPSIALLLFVFGHNLKNSEFHVLCWKLNWFRSCGSYDFYFLSKEKKEMVNCTLPPNGSSTTAQVIGAGVD